MRYSHSRILSLLAIALSTATSVFAQKTPSVPSITAAAKNITVLLSPFGTAVVSAQQLNNGSATTCSGLTYTVLQDGPVAGSISAAQGEYGTLSIMSPTGTTFTSITFASFGRPTPDVDENFQYPSSGFAIGDCNSINSQPVAESYILGHSTAAIPVLNSTFSGDPCGGAKRFYVTASYISGTPISSLTFTAAGTYPVFLVVQTNCGTRLAPATVTVIDARCGNKNDKVNLCHNGNQICVAQSAVAAHMAHGDSYGNCSTTAPKLVQMAASPAPTDMVVQASPNPSTDGQFKVHVESNIDGPVQVNLFDMQGNLVSQLYNGSMALGEQRDFTINRPDMKQGLYLVRVQNGAKATSIRLEVQK